ncbi:hypothetical protein NBRC116601_16500 [Cognatishimia sp. WU-CL00825]
MALAKVSLSSMTAMRILSPASLPQGWALMIGLSKEGINPSFQIDKQLGEEDVAVFVWS